MLFETRCRITKRWKKKIGSRRTIKVIGICGNIHFTISTEITACMFTCAQDTRMSQAFRSVHSPSGWRRQCIRATEFFHQTLVMMTCITLLMVTRGDYILIPKHLSFCLYFDRQIVQWTPSSGEQLSLSHCVCACAGSSSFSSTVFPKPLTFVWCPMSFLISS